MAAVAEPKSFASEPKLFGKTPRLGWLPVQPGTEPAVSAAYRQHLAVRALRTAAQAEGLITDGLLAEHLGYGTETLRRKMRGDYWASTEDLARWDLAFPEAGIYPDARLPNPDTLA